MAGRGGKSSSLTKDQLQAMGVNGKEIISSVQPPPLFPQLVQKPKLPDDNMERQYKIMWKDDFVSYLKDSPYAPLDKSAKTERPDSALEKSKERPNFCWNLMPPELRPNYKRSAAPIATSTVGKPNLVKRSRPVASLEDKLKLLEEREAQVPIEGAKIKTDPTAEEDEEEQVEDDALDDEMDEENDYGNTYFDNGEAFNEEDDNLDDGPVY